MIMQTQVFSKQKTTLINNLHDLSITKLLESKTSNSYIKRRDEKELTTKIFGWTPTNPLEMEEEDEVEKEFLAV